MANRVLLLIPLLLIQGLAWASGLAFSDNYHYTDYGDYVTEDEGPPHFVSEPLTLSVRANEAVTLPCGSANKGSNPLIVKKRLVTGGEPVLLFAEATKITRDKRLSLKDDNLIINKLLPRDAGQYICSFMLNPPVELRHSLDVQYAPTVRSLIPPEQRVLKGASVTLECEARGNPQPRIRWSKQGGRLPSGKMSEEGSSLTLEGVDRHVEGTYLCTAENGVGDAASSSMDILVEYKPEILPQKEIIRTGEGDQVSLVCVVHGRPMPTVSWTMDGRPVTLDDHVTAHDGGHRHTLTVKHVTDKDFGPYMCIAQNRHGQENAVIQMTGLPKKPRFTSSPNGGEDTQYTLTWETESYYPITDYQITYRRAQANHSLAVPGEWHDVMQHIEGGTTPLGVVPADVPVFNNNLNNNNNDDDENNNIPAAAASRNAVHSMARAVTNLEVATSYEATVKVKNKYGWSPESDKFSFSTRREVVQPSVSGACVHSSTLSLLALTCAALRRL